MSPAGSAPPEGVLHVDDLYGLAPDAFTAARNALAKQVKASGDKAGAAAIAKVRRPPITAWALNQVARNDRAEIDEVLRCGDDLRAAMDRALEGDASAVREAQRQERAAVEAALDAAARHLETQGHKGGEAARQRMAQTLRAALVDDEARAKLQRGVLDADVDAAGFGMGDLGGFALAPTPVPTERKATTPSTTAGSDAAPEPEDDAPQPTVHAPEAEAEPDPQPDPALVERVEAGVARLQAQQQVVDDARRRANERRADLERQQRALHDAEEAMTAAEDETSRAEHALQELVAEVEAAQQALAAQLEP